MYATQVGATQQFNPLKSFEEFKLNVNNFRLSFDKQTFEIDLKMSEVLRQRLIWQT